MWSPVILNKVFLHAQNSINVKKVSPTVVLLCTVPHILISTPWQKNHACSCQQQDGFILHDCFFSLLSNQYISNISNISIIYNPDKKLSLEYQTICDHMFSDPKSDHNFHIFWLRTWPIFFLLVTIYYISG